MSVAEAPQVAALAEEVARSVAFSRSKRHAALLQFLATQSAGAEIKETLIGHEFFGRPAGYDPKVDPVVRVEMRRLRERLQTYYDAEGASDTWRLDIPKGGYEIILAPGATPVLAEPAAPAPPPSKKPVLIAACALALIVAAALVAWRAALPRPISSIAVLPLVTTVAGNRAAAATAGLSREIAGELSRIVGLRVVGPEAAARAQALSRELPEIARRLGVDAILTGDARADSGRMQLQVQLSSGRDQTIIWTRTIERDLVDPFALQNELAASVAAAIHRDLLRAPAAQRPVSPDALFQYQQARFLLDRRSALALRQAIDGFRAATRADPLFANAWAALADTLAVYPDYDSPAPGWAAEARAAARQAIELDPDNADAYAALGWIEFAGDLRAPAATRLLSKAVAINPNHVLAQRRLAMVLLAQRRFRESEQRLRTALRLDALSPMVHINLAELFYYQSDFAREEPELRAVLELNPNFILARMMLANMLPRVNRCGEAVPLARRILEEPDGEAWRTTMAGALARCGDLSLARDLYRPDTPAAQREQMAEFFDDWPLALQFVQRIAREQPDFARNFSFGPDAPKYSRYPPIRAIFDTLEHRIQQPE